MSLVHESDTVVEARTKIVQTGDIVGGLPVAASSDGWRFDVSDDETQFMFSTYVNATPTTDDRVVVNSNVVAAAGTSTGSGGNWQEQFQSLSINNAGNYIFTAALSTSREAKSTRRWCASTCRRSAIALPTSTATSK